MEKKKILNNLPDAEAYAAAMRILPIHEEPIDPDLEEAFAFAETIYDLLSETEDAASE
jgi:hypothetical protein